MENETIQRLVIYAVMALLGIGIFLQLFYIHIQLSITQDTIRKRSFQIENIAKATGEGENKLRVYPIHINVGLTRKIQTEGRSMQNYIRQIVNKNVPYILPYICPQSVVPVRVQFEKIGFLVLNMGTGSDALYSDIKNERVRYIIVREQVFGVAVSETVNQSLIDSLILKKKQKSREEREENGDAASRKQEISLQEKQEIAQQLRLTRIIMLLPLLNHEIVDEDKEKINEFCVYRLYPFLGTITRKTSPHYFLDVLIDLIPTTVRQDGLLHIMGYRTI